MSDINQAETPEKRQEGQLGGWAPYYDLMMALMTFGREKKLRRMTVELSQLKPGDQVLEIGCGTGTLSIAAKAQAGPSGGVAGIDIAPEMIAQARRKAMRKGVDVTFQEGSIARIPFPENRFDVVMCSFMIFHMPEDVRREGFSEIYRVLKPGGHLFILDTESLDTLVPVLKENSFADIESGKTRFIVMGICHLRAKAEKIRKG